MISNESLKNLIENLYNNPSWFDICSNLDYDFYFNSGFYESCKQTMDYHIFNNMFTMNTENFEKSEKPENKTLNYLIKEIDENDELI